MLYECIGLLALVEIIEIRDESDVSADVRTAVDLAAASQKPAVLLALKPRRVSVKTWTTANPLEPRNGLR